MMEGRRYSEGLHQALEAKEGVTVQPENQTLASITFQNYFRLYPKLAGMTGTALTEADEFVEIYKLDVVEIPTNVPVHPHGRGRRGLSHRGREIRGGGEADRGGAAARPAGAGGHRQHREKRASLGHPEEEEDAAPGAERALPRAGGDDHRAGRRAGRGDDRHQHGRPRHRHQARRQSRDAAQARGSPASPTRPSGRRARRRSATRSTRGYEIVKQAGGLYRHRHRAPREPAHRQPVARPVGPAGRPGRVAILPVAGRRPDAHLRLRPDGRHAAPGSG